METRLTDVQLSELTELDRTHWLHPMGDLDGPPGAAPEVMFVSGSGATLTDASGRTYIDALASLWNVNVGHGRAELGQVAAEQIGRLAFSSAYGGFGHPPGVRLAAKLAELAPGDLEVTFFASGGAEANDTAYKISRLYWTLRGEPQRTKIVSRLRDYHGLTYGATSATGLPQFWKGFEPLAQGFLHAPCPDPYRYTGEAGSAGIAYARALEQTIQEAGPETVAAVVAEPIQGAGGVIVPPADYFPEVRKVCDRHGVLLIADEVITGFGRTGRWFCLEHYGIAPDLMIFAKGVTSGYIPLSGVMVTRAVHDTLKLQKGVFTHGFTYSGHPVACAVALANLAIIERERLVERAAEAGARLAERLGGLLENPMVGHVRSLGLIGGVELVRDKATKASYDAALTVARRVWLAALAEGVIVRPLPGDVIGICPPLTISDQELDTVVETLAAAIAAVHADLN
ncbi:MAG: aspartate aminotransferase family protein [Chloroflexota bacterium]